MPRGPLPDPHAARRNEPTIPLTELPISGRKGPIPKLPTWCPKLGRAGTAWWKWAWRTPESCGWSDSLIDIVARRATLVDDLNAISTPRSLVLDDLEDPELKRLVSSLAALAGGKSVVLKAMADCDAQLGLGAKNLAQLRWTIVDESAAKSPTSPAPVESSGSRGRLRVVNG